MVVVLFRGVEIVVEHNHGLLERDLGEDLVEVDSILLVRSQR